MSKIKALNPKCLLMVLDGFGISKNTNKNAISEAKKPYIDSLFNDYPFTLIEAGGELVGLPDGVAGNSEVGHMNLGAGRPVRQDLVRINESITDGSFATLPKLLNLIETAKQNSKRVHIMGLLSDGGVHSHIDHIKATFNALAKYPELKVFFHAFMDGRDTQKNTGAKYIKEIQEFKNVTLATMQGRAIAMDRDRRWEKIKTAYDLLTGHGHITSLDPLKYLENEYICDRFDEFVAPVMFFKEGAIESDDVVFFVNFRPDRAIQLSTAFMWDKFTEFPVPVRPKMFLCMSPYIDEICELPILFDRENIKGGISEFLSGLGKKQFKIAETEKYAHVTYFFNGGRREPFPNEEFFMVPSPKEVKTYDEKPQMSAPFVTDRLLQELDNNVDFYLVNYANSDMVGHTGNFEAAVKAIEALDECVKKIVTKCLEKNITVLITADHGNADEMVYPDGTPHTSHTKAPVPFCVVYPTLKGVKLEVNGNHKALKDVASTVLYTMGINNPPEFVGSTIFE